MSISDKDENSDENEDDTQSQAFILELPPTPEISIQVGTLFADDALAIATAKLTILECLLRLLVRDLKFTDFVREILLEVMKVVKSEAGSIFEINQKNNTLFFRASVGQSSDRIAHFTVPMGQGIVGHVAESRQPLVVSNVKENQKHLKTIDKVVEFETRNMVTVPILIRGNLYGVLQLLNRVGEETYTQMDVELLTYLCDLAAKSIEVRLMLVWRAQAHSLSGEAA